MLIYRRTSILESTAQTLVNTVNCVGIMGKGLAQDFKKLYPEMFAAYQKLCARGTLEPGKLWVWPTPIHLVLNFPTKKHWRNPSRIEYVQAGLDRFVHTYKQLGIREISFPRLGCGNGGLDWDEVRPLMESYLVDLPIPVFIHDFTKDIGLPEHLEFVTARLKSEYAEDDSFKTFMSSLAKAIKFSNGELVELKSKLPFDASIDLGQLTINSRAGRWKFESEDLLSIWYQLRTGLVTATDAEWLVGGGGRPLLSLLSILPDVRPVEILRWDAQSPEIAVELRPNFARAATVARKEQTELSWH